MLKEFLPRIYEENEIADAEMIEVGRENYLWWSEYREKLLNLELARGPKEHIGNFTKKKIIEEIKKLKRQSYEIFEEKRKNPEDYIFYKKRHEKIIGDLVFYSNFLVKKDGAGHFKEKIRIAKLVPMSTLLGMDGKIFRVLGKRKAVNCPLHNEKTPSFVIYPNNSFYCFGCGEGGDTISLVRKMKNMGFKEAVNYLTR